MVAPVVVPTFRDDELTTVVSPAATIAGSITEGSIEVADTVPVAMDAVTNDEVVASSTLEST